MGILLKSTEATFLNKPSLKRGTPKSGVLISFRAAKTHRNARQHQQYSNHFGQCDEVREKR